MDNPCVFPCVLKVGFIQKVQVRFSTSNHCNQTYEPNIFPDLLFPITTYSSNYSEVPNRRVVWNKRAGLEESATLLAYLISKLINEQERNFLFIMYMKN